MYKNLSKSKYRGNRSSKITFSMSAIVPYFIYSFSEVKFQCGKIFSLNFSRNFQIFYNSGLGTYSISSSVTCLRMESTFCCILAPIGFLCGTGEISVNFSMNIKIHPQAFFFVKKTQNLGKKKQ